jgi:hypothetical protein
MLLRLTIVILSLLSLTLARTDSK